MNKKLVKICLDWIYWRGFKGDKEAKKVELRSLKAQETDKGVKKFS